MKIYHDKEMQKLYEEYCDYIHEHHKQEKDKKSSKRHHQEECSNDECDGRIDIDFDLIYWQCMATAFLMPNLLFSALSLTLAQEEAFNFIRDSSNSLARRILEAMNAIEKDYEVVIKA